MTRILEISTDQTGPFKTVIEVLKDVLTDVNIECRSRFETSDKRTSSDKSKAKKNKKRSTETEDTETKDEPDENEEQPVNLGYMKIFAVDTTKTTLIDLKLDASSFTKFVCHKRMNLGINLVHFHKIIKIIDKDECLTLYVDDEERNNLNIKINNLDEQKDSVFKLKLLDLDETYVPIPDTDVETHIIMGSTEFHKTCREMQSMADYVEFQCLPDAFILKCKGEHLERTTRYKTIKNEQANANIEIEFKTLTKGAPKIVEGIYELKHLVSFSKFASLCSAVELYMRNDYPLVIKYTISSLGRLFLCLTPTDETNINDFNEDDQIYPDDG